MNEPQDRNRLFCAKSWLPRWSGPLLPPADVEHNEQDAVRSYLLPGFYAAGVAESCPVSLLQNLRAGDELELSPGDSAGAPLVRIEYGIFPVGYVPRSISNLLFRLLRRGFDVVARVGKVEPAAPEEQRLWIDACFLE